MFLDDFSRFAWIYPLKNKSDVVIAFNHFVALVKNQFKRTITALQSDNGGEFVPIHRLCDQLGIKIRFSCPHTSQQNGRVERKHRHLVETGLTLLAQASMPLMFWWESFMMAIILINGLPSQVLNGKSPMELMYDKCADFAALRTFGCACYPCLRAYQPHKFQFHTEKCVFGA